MPANNNQARWQTIAARMREDPEYAERFRARWAASRERASFAAAAAKRERARDLLDYGTDLLERGFTIREVAADLGLTVSALEIRARRYGYIDLQQQASRAAGEDRREAGAWRKTA